MNISCGVIKRCAGLAVAGLAIVVLALVAMRPSSASDSCSYGGGSCPSAPTISLSPTEFSLTEAGKTSGPMVATVTNGSNSTINISSTSISDQTDFSMPPDENGCEDAQLKRGRSCTLNLYFQPQSAGYLSASLSIGYGGHRSVSKGISGEAYIPAPTTQPTRVSFGRKTINSGRETSSVTLTNNAIIPITVESIEVKTLGSDPTPFDAEQGCVGTIAAGASCQLVTGFNPTETGIFVALVVIRDNFDEDVGVLLGGIGVPPGEPDIGLSTNALEFGQVQVGSASGALAVTLVSTGTGAVTISGITASGDFAVTDAADCVKALAPAAFCTIHAVFTPSAGGERSGTISIADDAPDSPQEVALSGVGVDPAAPSVDLSTTSLNFGKQTVGTTGETLYVVLANVGGAALTVSDVAATGVFVQQNDCVGIVAAGGRCAMAVQFAPVAVGSVEGTLTITDNASGSPHVVNLAGEGTEQATPQASLSATAVDFGEQTIDTSSAVQTVTLTNTGTADLSVGLTSIDGEGAASYGKSDTCRESVVEAGSSCSIDIVFTPTATGELGAVLSIADDSSGSPQTVTLSGFGSASGGGGGGGGGCSLIVPARNRR